MITAHITGWALEIAKDCKEAESSISISAISMFPPLRNADGDFCHLWQSWCEAAARGVSVDFFLPAAMQAHPATLRNHSAARMAYERGMNTHVVQGPRLLHAKSVIVDHRIVWIGSGNMTAAAAGMNHEFYVRFEHHEIAERLRTYLNSIATQ